MICYKCFTFNEEHELRPSGKIKSLSAESSRKLKTCKNCKCRVFFTQKQMEKKHEDIIPGDILENNNLVFGVVKFINQNSDELQFILLTENDYYNKITLGTDTVKERVPNYNTLFNSILNIA